VTGSLARRYARALLGLARESGAVVAASEELSRATAVFADPALGAVVLNPGIAATARRAIVGRVVERLGLAPMVGNLVRLLADRDRLGLLPDVARAYEVFVDRELGRARVSIRSATALAEAQRAELEHLARRLTGSQQVVASVTVDPELIGGVVLDASGTVYDGSVKTQLERLADRMAGTGA
jgi:F-type H+-transporting ATPase subunit delta